MALRRILELLWLKEGTLLLTTYPSNSPGLPMVINTWSGPFQVATNTAYLHLINSINASSSSSSQSSPSHVHVNPSVSLLDAVQAGLSACERDGCNHSVGAGGSFDESCETTLDAMIMNGDTMDVGAVAGLRRIRDAAAVARRVLDETRHSLLVGDSATRFAVERGFVEEDLGSDWSRQTCGQWKRGGCVPNYRRGGALEEGKFCEIGDGNGPVLVDGHHSLEQEKLEQGTLLHDTVSLMAIHPSGSIAGGTSTNGATHKIPGRVGDGAIPGSGMYVDSQVGGCGATGDGDIMMRFLPCHHALQGLRRGLSPQAAADDAIEHMVRRLRSVGEGMGKSDERNEDGNRHGNGVEEEVFQAGIVVVDIYGSHAGSATGDWEFTYSFRGPGMEESQTVEVKSMQRLFTDEL